MFRYIALALIPVSLVACGKQNGAAKTPPSFLPPADFVADAQQGVALYAQHCARCHGEQGMGTDVGPPMIHRYYEPSHHADIAFYRAVNKGVAAHHWNFGDMPPVEGVSPQHAGHIIAHIRAMQRAAGIN
jgi:mono/diheme cytochrome c family protein